MMAIKRKTPLVVMILCVWLAAALVLGASGRMQALHPPLPQLVIAGLTLASIVLFSAVAPLRAWAMAVRVDTLVALHLTRLVGIYFLVLSQQGLLARDFAVPVGWGDLVVAALAIALLIFVRTGTGLLYAVWNVLGLIDILAAVVTAARVGLSNPEGVRPLLTLPLSLVPTFLVPLIIASHVLIGVRLARSRAPAAPGG